MTRPGTKSVGSGQAALTSTQRARHGQAKVRESLRDSSGSVRAAAATDGNSIPLRKFEGHLRGQMPGGARGARWRGE